VNGVNWARISPIDRCFTAETVGFPSDGGSRVYGGGEKGCRIKITGMLGALRATGRTSFPLWYAARVDGLELVACLNY
jgi:hypothetical protein